MDIKLIQHNSNEYEQMIHLRITQLLQPIGIPASYIEEEKEATDFLVGAFENNELIGCCILTPKENGIIQLRQMAVEKGYRGKRVGPLLLTFLKKWREKITFQ